ncbi:uncharacterized protein LTR77_000729 [Saxophila tyrrhenica]|uniref:NmrA-like domain-containing protein n=1 Tax=Saxophila tyrrhenica TaxID=1690608 RepID=A0AAV9PQ36_9PEZI|nr:hypothetical protein LTR77_000729 [Saxophila tyrrhenica]
MSVDTNNDLILITAASGKQARGLLPHLTGTWKHLRLNVASQASADRLKQQYPGADVTQHDISDPHACDTMLQGVTACFLVTPAFHPQETQCGINVINAARSSMQKMMNHDAKRYIEEYLVESGVPHTIIQPTHLMETLPLAKIVEEAEKDGKASHPLFWDPSVPSTSVSTRDVGEAAAKILAERERHFSATYQLVGTRAPISYTQIAAIVSEEIGKPFSIEQKPIDDGVKAFNSMMTSGKPETADFLMKQGPARMFMYYNGRGIIGNPNVLEMLLGRKALDYRDWVKMGLKEIKGQ